MLHIDVKVGESIKVGDATIKIIQKSGQRVKLVVDADKSVVITHEKANGN
jgi:sRNA-binding carbon storage regulator CsrA